MNTLATEKASVQAVPMVIVSPETTQTKAKKARKHNRGKERKRSIPNLPINPTNKSTNRSDGVPRNPYTSSSTFLHDASSIATKDSNSGESKICEVIVIYSDSSEDEEDSVGGYVYLTPPAKPHTLIPTLTAVKEELSDHFEGFTEEDYEMASQPKSTNTTSHLHATLPPLAPNPMPTLTVRSPHCAPTALMNMIPAYPGPLPLCNPYHVTQTHIDPTITAPFAPVYNTPPVNPASPVYNAPPDNPVLPQVTEAFLEGITPLIYRGECNAGQDKLNTLVTVARLQSSFHPGIIQRVPQELLPNVVVNHWDNAQEFGIGNLVNPVENLLSSLTLTACLGQCLWMLESQGLLMQAPWWLKTA